ncbi:MULTISPECIES: RHS repeat-associated core domain-containing protein [unclassified Undibacterium]|uniref:RHS repeat-associated core domain-containing protein n=1 Tax=unclassified Undibacterium TaxID=2630295 RepID=UPI002AC91998|nr:MULTISPECIES: RHS repeat-associated core domain-containing protein [unclassified Undibacterium]MEB0141147.1 RHS repeat-associated core domain-containing protein [Undibacterium sp. CCC2.1]MEB0174180.1 RHS repeat-associated core domain-containing protein [Undibacterium sp. CCC1.1]MEB0178122.1 RHS repeat-associated core domain-containing protein [Undibacterium sp. CCC3.4]MEB0217327.1 RHS repeat-associated core domain-containing protein [Undibacterium sp. 5I2]WPX44633.1 RHS repeat-associated co
MTRSSAYPLARIYARRSLSAALLAICAVAQAQTSSPQNTTYRYEYDVLGNVTKITNPLQFITQQSYDVLGRLTSQTDANNQVTQYVYDGQNRLKKVIDARQLSTLYTLDGLGNQLSLSSPDTGIATNTFDAAGNVVTATDAKGQTTRFTYDVLNRVTSITYSDAQVTTYTYDQGANAKGRLSQITDPLGSITLSYDGFGHVVNETRSLSVNGSMLLAVITYQYDAAGRLSKLTYPNGRQISYTRDSMERISQIDSTKDDTALTVLSQVIYEPFGPVQTYLNSTGQAYRRSLDLDGRISSFTLNKQVQTISYDAASRIVAINEANNPARQSSYGYDALDRLSSYLTPQSNQSFTYDAVGNRNSKTTGAASTSYSYGSASNRLMEVSGTSVINDANGSITDNGSSQFSYDVRARLTSVTTNVGTTNYRINAYGQRVQKISSSGSTWYHYDQAGLLISESNGECDVDYVYLDSIPVAVLPCDKGLHDVHTDHLNTPRVITNSQGVEVWRWDSMPFGESAPNENPGNTGVAHDFTFNQRFAGQYYDQESGLHYNYYRDYDPSTGRYITSDPIGLRGGPNTYAYVGGIH